MNLEKRKYGEKESDFDYYLDVTKYVKPLFGNILSKAEFVIDGYNTEQEAKEQAREAIKYFQKIENSIDVDAECLLLYLKNGIKIEFSTSEWGCIRFPSSSKKDFSGDKLENLSDDKIGSYKKCFEESETVVGSVAIGSAFRRTSDKDGSNPC